MTEILAILLQDGEDWIYRLELEFCIHDKEVFVSDND
jgi:hypothetical protein